LPPRWCTGRAHPGQSPGAHAALAGTDSGAATRTWQQALDAIVETKSGSTQDRWRRAAKETALDSIRNRIILETQAEHLLACLKAGTVSTNVHLRKLHNFCISMNWLPWPLIPKRLWPEVRFKDKRAITIEEHQLIIEREKNPERRSFYELRRISVVQRHANLGGRYTAQPNHRLRTTKNRQPGNDSLRPGH
jgi:hypothetical protein